MPALVSKSSDARFDDAEIRWSVGFPDHPEPGLAEQPLMPVHRASTRVVVASSENALV
ncbi:hypothetical protein OCU_39780 [Mycobacterium intracellulare ATCC 13950]|uniref:Uncharacterized protein n=1 Tax=Mycobacterium intracellulare (strain ATCC 13950 / DSM 43223 / JCM 6384 / NCTC 13025 / 3600) TaxID=487521 RepID=H8IN14_MYCIA|nr:hypothetical protein OCU_39780 [Mycobacterium intracellulare ATCC 13950]